MAELLLGDEAVGLGAIDAGIRGAFSYPGTPATEVMECIRQRGGEQVVARWSVNEKVAYEEAMGMSYVGGRCLISMKHVGLNVAADPFMSSALTGTVGGMVLVVADDPGMHSSQNEQDTRFYADFAKLPLFEPANQQEAYDMTREAFELSERFALPIMLRLVTRLAHSRAPVARRTASEVPLCGTKRGKDSDWTLLPPNARRRYQRVLDLQPALVEYARHSPFNELTLRGSKGIIACGPAYNYVREAVGEDSSYSLLKIGTHPVPVDLIRRLVDHCTQVLVAEEGYPLVEGKLTGLLGVPGKHIVGRRTGVLPAQGELSVDALRAALGTPGTLVRSAAEALPSRPPRLCDGCPHCDSFHAVLEAIDPESKPILFSDIGCYTLGAYPPFSAVHACVDMGASISMAIGAAKAGAHPVLCTIGDSTFTHSGMPPLLQAAFEDTNITVVLLDNAAVAMTGGQDGLVTGDQFLRLLRGLGVDPRHLVRIDPIRKDHAENVRLLRNEIEHRGLSVIVASRPCIHMKRRDGHSVEKPRRVQGETDALDEEVAWGGRARG